MPIDKFLFNFLFYNFLIIVVICNRVKITPSIPVPPISRPTSPHLSPLSSDHISSERLSVHQRRYASKRKFINENQLIDSNLNEDEVFDKMEFVRTAGKKYDEIYKFEKRQYSTFPRQFECYSCMSLSYQENWEHLQFMYTTPKVFTNRCNDPFMQKNIPTVLCGSFCASLLEPNLEGGVFLGYKYIRGCIDRILRHGFNQSALRTHRFNQVDQCRSLPRSQLFNPPKGMDMPFFGDVQLCSCYGDKCNGASSANQKIDLFTASIIFMIIQFCLSLITVPHFNLIHFINR